LFDCLLYIFIEKNETSKINCAKIFHFGETGPI